MTDATPDAPTDEQVIAWFAGMTRVNQLAAGLDPDDWAEIQTRTAPDQRAEFARRARVWREYMLLKLTNVEEANGLIIEEREAFVTLTVRLTTRISFVRAPREGRITNSDFIENAIGSLPHGWLEAPAEEGWKVAYPIDGEVHEEP